MEVTSDFEIQSFSCKAKWSQALSFFYDYDVFHTYDYHQLCSSHVLTPELFVITSSINEYKLAIPLLRRNLYANFVDYTSAYGYPSPLLSLPGLQSLKIDLMYQSFLNYLRSLGIASLFLRGSSLNSDFSRYSNLLGETFVIDIRQHLAGTFKYSKQLQYDLRRATREGISCEFVNPGEYIDQFINIYTLTMSAVGASDQYYYDSDYYQKLLDAKDFKLYICVARHHHEIISSSMFLACGKRVHYHLSGTHPEHYRFSPNKVILDLAISFFGSLGYEYLHLGGGVGSRKDALSKFKNNFTDLTANYSQSKIILDDILYFKHCTYFEKPMQHDFFPAYLA